MGESDQSIHDLTVRLRSGRDALVTDYSVTGSRFGAALSELVDELIGRSRELSNFELGDHLVSRNRKRALETLHRLLEGGAIGTVEVG